MNQLWETHSHSTISNRTCLAEPLRPVPNEGRNSTSSAKEPVVSVRTKPLPAKELEELDSRAKEPMGEAHLR